MDRHGARGGVRKGGDSTCEKELAYMKTNYAEALSGSTSKVPYRMITCEDFAKLVNRESDAAQQVSPCDEMMTRVNGIYRVVLYGTAIIRKRCRVRSAGIGEALRIYLCGGSVVWGR